MSTSELDNRNIAISMRKSVENLVVSSDAIGQSISQALTFSNVLAHGTAHGHATHAPRNRSVSRSPSPSLRSAESGGDIIDNDRGAEASMHMPALADGSVSSSSDVAAARGDAKSATPTQLSRAGAGEALGVRTKKKSWYNALYPTYKNKSDDFKRLFKELPEDERLIVDYSCALQKDILAQGRLYASQNYLCFYASIFGWETTLALRWKDITAITKEKTALVIPNAILVCTREEKHFLASFTGRDKAYLMLFRVWQNALMDQPMTSQDIWQWVHSCYGDELGFNSDEEGYSRDLIGFPLEPAPDTISEVELMESSLEGAGEGAEAEARPPRSVSRQRDHEHDHSPPIVSNGVSETEYGRARAPRARSRTDRDTLPTDLSDSSDSEPDKTNVTGERCSSPHSGKLMLRQRFPFNIDQLFTMIFTNSQFNLELLAARGTTDYVQAQWQPQAGLKCRQVSYMLSLTSGPLGPKQVHVTETQVMNKCSKPGVLYSIDASSENTGIPYADYFTVEVHYCLQRATDQTTELAIYGHVKYKKSTWGMVKTFLEKSTMSGVEEYARLIEARLAAEADGAAPVRKGRRHRRATALSQEQPPSLPSPALAPRAPPRPPRPRAAPWLGGCLVLLLLLNGLLYWRLYHHQWRPIAPDALEARMNALSGEQLADWSGLLAKHTRRQRGQLNTWRNALKATVVHLKQTEEALRNLLATIEPSLEQAQQEAGSPNHPTDPDGASDTDEVPPDGASATGAKDADSGRSGGEL